MSWTAEGEGRAVQAGLRSPRGFQAGEGPLDSQSQATGGARGRGPAAGWLWRVYTPASLLQELPSGTGRDPPSVKHFLESSPF